MTIKRGGKEEKSAGSQVRGIVNMDIKFTKELVGELSERKKVKQDSRSEIKVV